MNDIKVGDEVYYKGYADVYKATVVAKKTTWFSTKYVITISQGWAQVVSANRLFKKT